MGGALDAGLGKQNPHFCLLTSRSEVPVYVTITGKLTNPPDTWAHFSPVTLESLGFEPEHLKMTPGDSNLVLA